MRNKSMGYLSAWKVLEEMIAEFRKRGLPTPPEVISDLKSAKTLINILKADPTCTEKSQKIEEFLMKVESYLASEGQKKFGAEYVETWLRRVDEAMQKPHEEEEEAETRFVPGLPREHKWIRVKPSSELPIEKLKRLAEESNLSYEMQSDGCLLVYGEEARIKDFVKKSSCK
ncbi:MAG: DUF2096 family protein [Candidatus Bathyarchaeales archaeon]